jgi:trk system potassium uptake protein TrkA
MRKQFAVLGLGSFGRSVALTLESMGCDVIVVDKSQETIQEIADRVTYAITADITEKEALSALGTRNLDGAIIGVDQFYVRCEIGTKPRKYHLC